ncbi:hypothetical protein C8Q79DRAFT_957567 [Trametes meyenii]|nr:hypothetical protein C8Q79DRAFT_957567 [Trametes meyenii]
MPLTHRGYGVYISCDGRELEQLRVKTSEQERSASCYVCSDTGKDFRVHWVDSKPPTHLSVEIRVDGSRIGVISHTKGSSKPSTSGIFITLENRDLTRDETDDDALPSAYSEELGTVEVRLRRVRDFVTVPFIPKHGSTLGPSRERNAPVANRRLTGSTKSTTVGRRPGTSAKSTILRPILIDDKPYVVFRFFYRPKDVLEAKGILDQGSSSSSAVGSSSSRRARRKRLSVESSPTAAEPRLGGRPPSKRRRVSTGSQVSAHARKGEDDSVDAPFPADEQALDQRADNWNPPDQDMESIVEPQWPLQVPDLAECLPMDAMDNDEDEEQVVEIHLSAQGGFAFPSSGASAENAKREPIDPTPVKLEPPSEDDNPSWLNIARSHDVNPKIEEEEESVVEVRVNSRNQHMVFGAARNVAQEPTVKKEESPEQDLILEDAELVSVKCEDPEKDTVEVHISSKDIQRAFDRSKRDTKN